MRRFIKTPQGYYGLGSRIKRLKEIYGMTWDELSRYTHISATTLCALGRGIGTVKESKLETFATAFGLTVEELIADELEVKVKC